MPFNIGPFELLLLVLGGLLVFVVLRGGRQQRGRQLAAQTDPDVDVGDRLVLWLRGLPGNRSAAIAAQSELPSPVVRTYPGRTQAEAAGLFQSEAQLLGEAGYQPVSQSWMEGRAGIGRTVALGLYANVIRPNGFLTVTFTRPKPLASTQQPRATKICPECAEEVLADARICRFCRHAFEQR